jgi:hypothetical protein
MRHPVRTGAYVFLFLALATGIPGFVVFRMIMSSRSYVLEALVEDLDHTTVTPHLEHPLEPGRNAIYCSTFQLAWNEACACLGEDIHLENEPPMVGVLNKKKATRDDLDDASFIALAGRVRDGIIPRIEKSLEEKFKGKVNPRFVPKKEEDADENDIFAYAYLFKSLAFPVPFERLHRPIQFGGSSISCFGMINENVPEYEAMYSQVLIHDYVDENDFVIELKTCSHTDEFILAKIPKPEATLEKTIASVCMRMGKEEPGVMRKGDILKIPRMNFDLTREYRSLYKKRLILKKSDEYLLVFKALQNIRFRLDEKGAELESEAVIHFGWAARPDSECIMVFDRPFLLMLRMKGRPAPYFVMWVGHPEILVPKR